jgi:polysaccharide export outer membrane protein
MRSMWKVSSRGLIPALFVVALVGCGGSNAARDAETKATGAGEAEYRIGPGDQLRIFVWNQPEISGLVPVRPDGHISTPLVEDLLAAGRTPSELARDLEARLAEFIRTPKVNVIVENFQGTVADQIKVVGQAKTPRALPFKSNMTLLDVMIEVGGLTEFAAGNRARVIRVIDGKETEIPVRIKDLLTKGRMEDNLKMRPGDVVVIPESIF